MQDNLSFFFISYLQNVAWKTLNAEELTKPGWFWSDNKTNKNTFWKLLPKVLLLCCSNLLQWEQDQALLIPGIY